MRPVGRRLDAVGRDADEALFDVGAGLAQEHLQDHLGLLVLALAEVVVADLALGVDEVQGGPVVVVERLPDGEVVVHHDGVADVHLLDGPTDVVEVALEVELGRLDADDRQPVRRVLRPPTPARTGASGSS